MNCLLLVVQLISCIVFYIIFFSHSVLSFDCNFNAEESITYLLLSET